MTMGLAIKGSLQVAISITQNLEKSGASIGSIYVEQYHKYDNSHMITFSMKISSKNIHMLTEYLDSVSPHWKSTTRTDSELYQVLDLRDKDTTFLGAVWVLLEKIS